MDFDKHNIIYAGGTGESDNNDYRLLYETDMLQAKIINLSDVIGSYPKIYVKNLNFGYIDTELKKS